MLSIRLKEELENRVRAHAARLHLSTSEFVRRTLEERLRENQADTHPWALGKDLFGRHASGDTDRAERAEDRLHGKLRERHGR